MGQAVSPPRSPPLVSQVISPPARPPAASARDIPSQVTSLSNRTCIALMPGFNRGQRTVTPCPIRVTRPEAQRTASTPGSADLWIASISCHDPVLPR
ncbi:hypothetical protein CF326_g4231 [Tilletia indica]|nr:hypothetical protein CF326_g4231 [Tilletia indica]